MPGREPEPRAKAGDGVAPAVQGQGLDPTRIILLPPERIEELSADVRVCPRMSATPCVATATIRRELVKSLILNETFLRPAAYSARRLGKGGHGWSKVDIFPEISVISLTFIIIGI